MFIHSFITCSSNSILAHRLTLYCSCDNRIRLGAMSATSAAPNASWKPRWIDTYGGSEEKVRLNKRQNWGLSRSRQDPY
jgi:hypothetical protein